MWVFLAIASSALLGGYDLLKKASLKNNAFLPVLYLGTCSSALLFFTLLLLCRTSIIDPENILYIPTITPQEHFLFFLKAVIVGSSWFFAYKALSKLPITIVVPIRATGPIWAVTGAFFIFQERFTGLQWAGIIIGIISSFIFAIAGKKEGIHFRRNKWVWAIIAGTLIGAVSGLYDKFLLLEHHRMAVQAWFSIYMIVVLLPFLLILWYPNRKDSPDFKWRWTIPTIGIVLSIADFFYFYALADPDALIGVISVIRRGSVVIAFSLGALIFKEGNLKSKSIGLAGILIGIILLVLGS